MGLNLISNLCYSRNSKSKFPFQCLKYQEIARNFGDHVWRDIHVESRDYLNPWRIGYTENEIKTDFEVLESQKFDFQIQFQCLKYQKTARNFRHYV